MTELDSSNQTDLSLNIIKTREDHRPTLLERADGSTQEKPKFKPRKDSASWAEESETLTPSDLRPRIEPWLTALCQSEHLSLLLGSGLTNAVHRIATGIGHPGMTPATFGDFQDLVDAEADRSAAVAGRKNGNIEDQIRGANELARGYEILGARDKDASAKARDLRSCIDTVLATFAVDVLSGEQNLLTASSDNRTTAFNYLVSFLMSFASRTGTRDRLHLFTTNYDRYIEAGAEAAGMHLLDRFVGSLAPIFRSSRLDLDLHYNPPGIRGEPRYLEGVARFSKLHGSLDWISNERDICRIGLPFGATELSPYLATTQFGGGTAAQLMIYPNAAKDRETSAYPYVELFRDFAAAVCRPNHTLIAFGFAFGDEHINRVIEDMLTIPSTHLVVISYSDPLGRIMSTYERLGRHAQISLLIGNHLGDFRTLVDHYLPKPAIDRTTFRMTELLQSRWDRTKPPKHDAESAQPVITETIS